MSYGWSPELSPVSLIINISIIEEREAEGHGRSTQPIKPQVTDCYRSATRNHVLSYYVRTAAYRAGDGCVG